MTRPLLPEDETFDEIEAALAGTRAHLEDVGGLLDELAEGDAGPLVDGQACSKRLEVAREYAGRLERSVHDARRQWRWEHLPGTRPESWKDLP